MFPRRRVVGLLLRMLLIRTRGVHMRVSLPPPMARARGRVCRLTSSTQKVVDCWDPFVCARRALERTLGEATIRAPGVEETAVVHRILQPTEHHRARVVPRQYLDRGLAPTEWAGELQSTYSISIIVLNMMADWTILIS
jgi:hypothetical protein